MLEPQIKTTLWDKPLSPKGASHFGTRLKWLIGDNSLRSFAKGCGISDATLRKYLNKGTLPCIDKIEAIAKYTECSLVWLITGEKDTTSAQTKTEAQSLEEIKKWWGIISEALTAEQKEKIIQAFKLGGANAIFISTWIENE